MSLSKFGTIGAIALLTLISSSIPTGILPGRSIQVLAQTQDNRQTEAERLLQQGAEQYQTSQFQAALQSWQQALEIYREIGDRAGEGNSLNGIGNVYANLGEYSQALESYEQALSIVQEVGDRTREGATLNRIGNIYADLGQSTQALESYQQALSIVQEVGNRALEGTTLNNIGSVYADLGQYPQALQYHQQALSIAQEIGDSSAESLARRHIEEIRQTTELGVWQEFSSIEGGFSVLMPGTPTEQSQLSNLDDEIIEEQNFFMLELESGAKAYGVGYFSFSNVPESLNSNQINELFDSVRDGLIYGGRLLSERRIALESYLGREIEFEDAQRTVQKARMYWVGERLYLLLVVRLPDTTFTEDSDWFLESFKLLENVSTTSLNTLEQTQTTQERHAEANITAQLAEAEQLFQQGFQHRRNNQSEASTQSFVAAVQLWQQALTTCQENGDRQCEASILNDLGGVYHYLEQDSQALESHQRALNLYRASGDRAGEGLTLWLIGEFYRVREEYSQAAESYQQALPLLREVGDYNTEHAVLNNLGTVYSDLGQHQQALESHQQALRIAKELGNRRLEATSLNHIAILQNHLGQYSQALESYQQALSIHRAVGNWAGERTTLNNIGLVYRSQGQYPQALESLQQALSIMRELGDRAGEETILNNIGLVYDDQGQYPQALESYQQALSIAQEVGDRIMEGTILNNIGSVYDNLRQYPQALESYQQALPIGREVGDQAMEGITLHGIGNIYFYQGQYLQALEPYQQALSIAREVGDRAWEGTTLTNIGSVYANQRQYLQALESFRQALSICQENGDRRCEAINLNELGTVYHYLGQDDALVFESHQQALNLYRTLGDRAEEGYTLSAIAELYRVREEYSQAIRFYQEALPLIKEAGDFAREYLVLNNLGTMYADLGQNYSFLEEYQEILGTVRARGNEALEADILERIGQEYGKLGQYPQALDYFEQALNIYREQSDRIGEGLVFQSIGSIYSEQEQYSQALNYFQQALTLIQEGNNQLIETNILNNIGSVYFNSGQYSEALGYFQQMLSLIQGWDGEYSPEEERALSNIGVTLFELGQLELAETTLLDALAISNLMRQRNLTDIDRVSLFDRQVYIYTILQQVQVAQNKIEPALETSEWGRARAFVSLLSQQLQEVSTTTNLSTPSVSDIQQIAREQNATLVQYSVIYTAVGTPAIYIWVISPTGEIAFRSIELNEENQQALSGAIATTFGENTVFRSDSTTISNLVSNVRPPDRSTSRDIEIEYDPNLASDSLRQLHQLLIEPIADLLPTNESDRLIFIPQGGLFLVPFAALQDANGDYLIEKHTISIAPSIQILDLTRQQRQPDRGLQNALVVGNPIMPQIWNTQTSTEIPLSPLPGAEREAEAIAQFLNTEAIIGEAATETAITEQMPDAQIIHLATHGLLEYGIPSQSGVLDVPGAIALTPSSNEDGLLTSAEILEMDLQAELVVLSACDTGQGRITGDGVVGLSRAFIGAGVPSVVVSLWSVPDAPTADLMTEFYHQLETQPDKAQALRQAMLITMQQHPDPRDWAAFSLIGEAQ